MVSLLQRFALCCYHHEVTSQLISLREKLPYSELFWFAFSRIWTEYEEIQECPYSELFWSAFSRIWTEYGEILRISPYSVRMRENVDQNNSEYGHFLRSACFVIQITCSDWPS